MLTLNGHDVVDRAILHMRSKVEKNENVKYEMYAWQNNQLERKN